MKNLKEKLAAKELEKRSNIVPINILDECLPYQLNFIKDENKRKAVCGTRRAAKSFMFALYLINQALTVSKSKCIYMGLTNESCKQIMWTDILEIIFDKYHIKAECSSKYEIEFENKSVIYLRGLDATPHQMNRLRGQKFDIAVIDEVQDFTQDIEQIIDGVLKMSLAQTGATLCLGGTPGNKQGEHYWWLVNKDNSLLTQWKLFHFDWKDNTSIEPKNGLRVCDAIKAEIDKDLLRNPLIAKTPKFQQEVLGLWVIDTDARVYRSTDENYVDDGYLAPWFFKNCVFNLTLDLGYVDATAYVVSAYNQRYDNNNYIIESVKLTSQTITAVATTIKEYMKRYDFQTITVDAANLQAVEEMRQIHSLPLKAAQKQGKEAHIALMNSDFITKNIFILKTRNAQLISELNTLIWDPRALLRGEHKEDSRKDNHLTDALLYGHHASRHYWFKSFAPPVPFEESIVQEIERQFLPKPKMKTITTAWWEENE